MKQCPFCEEQIQDEAVKCRYCKEWLSQPGEATQEPENIPGQDEPGIFPIRTGYKIVHSEKKLPEGPSQQLDSNQPQAVNNASAIKDTETWFSRYYKALLASAIILPLLVAIVIPIYLVTKERTRNAQNQQAPAPSAVQSSTRTIPVGDDKSGQPAPAPISAEPELPAGYKAVVLMADTPLDKTPVKAVDIIFKYKTKGSNQYASKVVMQNVPVISYSVAERHIKIHIPDEDAEKLKIESRKGKLQVLPIQ